MTEEKAPANQRILAGILFMCGAGLLFPVMGGFAKFLGEAGYNSLQVSWARAFGHLVFMMAFFVPRFGESFEFRQSDPAMGIIGGIGRVDLNGAREVGDGALSFLSSQQHRATVVVGAR